jgi:copper ion binding protein
MSNTETVNVTGMTCGHCVAAVTEEISKLDGVTDVAVDLESGRVVVTSDAALDRGLLTAAVDEAGYVLVD